MINLDNSNNIETFSVTDMKNTLTLNKTFAFLTSGIKLEGITMGIVNNNGIDWMLMSNRSLTTKILEENMEHLEASSSDFLLINYDFISTMSASNTQLNMNKLTISDVKDSEGNSVSIDYSNHILTSISFDKFIESYCKENKGILNSFLLNGAKLSGEYIGMSEKGEYLCVSKTTMSIDEEKSIENVVFIHMNKSVSTFSKEGEVVAITGEESVCDFKTDEESTNTFSFEKQNFYRKRAVDNNITNTFNNFRKRKIL